jgi:hypothetical protein
MDALWQYIVIGAIIAGAAGYLSWHFWQKAFRKKTPCASCGLMKLAEKRDIPRSLPQERP